MDKITQQRIAELHPSIRTEVEVIVNEINACLTGRAQFRISQGFRSFDQQAALYAQGRTTKGSKVTYAKAGESIHNYGFAVDGVLIIDGSQASWDFKKDFDQDKVADWDEVVKVFAKHGWSWGGNWNSRKDMPHFEKIGFNNYRILGTKKRDSAGYIII
jgi:peptidoglycan L-alanyl-D-glutamate endopeptidase CwlK